MSKKKIDPVKEIIASLASKDEKIVLRAVQRIKKDGDDRVVEPMINVWISTDNRKIRDGITEVLNSLRDERAIAPLVRVLKRNDLGEFKAMLLSAFWNMPLSPTEHVNTFAEIAVDGDYMEAMECLTIVENLEPPFQEELLLEAQLTLRTALAEGESEKDQLLKDMLGVLEGIEAN